MDLTTKQVKEILEMDTEDLATLGAKIMDELANRAEATEAEASSDEISETEAREE